MTLLITLKSLNLEIEEFLLFIAINKENWRSKSSGGYRNSYMAGVKKTKKNYLGIFLKKIWGGGAPLHPPLSKTLVS